MADYKNGHRVCREPHRGVESTFTPLEPGLALVLLWPTDCFKYKFVQVRTPDPDRPWSFRSGSSWEHCHHHHVNKHNQPSAGWKTCGFPAAPASGKPATTQATEATNRQLTGVPQVSPEGTRSATQPAPAQFANPQNCVIKKQLPFHACTFWGDLLHSKAN